MRIRKIIIAAVGAALVSGCAYDDFGYGDGYYNDYGYGYGYGYQQRPRQCWNDYYGYWYTCY